MNRLNQLLQFLESTPNDPFLLFAIAKEQEKLGDSDAALDWYLKLQETDPSYVGLYYHLGKLYEGKNELEKAINTYEAGMNVAKAAGDVHALGELAGAKLYLED